MATEFLTKGPISPEIIVQLIEKIGFSTDSGGHTIFLGQVRADIIKGKKVRAIEYSAYEDMIDIEAKKITGMILSEFNDVRAVYILHSTGTVNVGQISLMVVVSSGHRHQLMEACGKTVEIIKEKLPIWKKEIFEDDSHFWK